MLQVAGWDDFWLLEVVLSMGKVEKNLSIFLLMLRLSQLKLILFRKLAVQLLLMVGLDWKVLDLATTEFFKFMERVRQITAYGLHYIEPLSLVRIFP